MEMRVDLEKREFKLEIWSIGKEKRVANNWG